MSSPEVWDEALARATAAAGGLQVPLVEVGLQDNTDHQAPYLMFETAANTADRIELGGEVWSEEGQIWIHVMIQSGTGIRPGMVLRKAIASAFRFAKDLPIGLVYLGASFPPPDQDDRGNWISLSLAVDYRYQDAPTPTPPSS